ncbi:ribonuclease J [Thiorhodococcus minor]|uniref:Ribonuclease J n=1 Tax=Thiorhodococcus minor TaxID=57489 RepID=A0A6M0K3U7_9GAMM|nr:ribonuclease J [Thiorhodococcus minor]NEV63921.1 ribonuclease J [Thiorhodococcus minor]
MAVDDPSDLIPKSDEILFLPLGGVGEIGMNLALYGHDGAWLIVDIGITFGGDDFPDHRVMMADPSFITARRARLAGILLTHGHEDHIGALPHLWRRLRCPIYATPFTAALVRYRLAQAGAEDAVVEEVTCGERFQVGPFDVEYIGMTHSIPEPNAILLRTAAGALLHTGDWKLDDRPVVGRRYDVARLHALKREPLLALVGDSTNAVVEGTTGSESDLFAPLREVAEHATGRVVVTSFASNVARLVTLARVAEAVGRRFGVVGQAMERMVAVARATGYWPDDLPELVDARHLGFLPREEVFAACTGSQGEPGSALVRMAADSHRHLLLDPGDSVIFSSKLIPGNERSVERLQARLRELRIEVTTDLDAEIHVSGHPAQGDLARLYGWIQPPLLIPAHGTPRHLAANAAVADACHIPQVRLMANGDVCRLTPQGAGLLGSVESGRLTLKDDGRLVPVSRDLLDQMRAKVH